MWDTVSPARALMSSNIGTGGVCLAFWVPLAAQHKTTSGTAIEKMWEENGSLTLWRVRKTKSLYPGRTTLSTAPLPHESCRRTGFTL
jgi:hypothetical protein